MLMNKAADGETQPIIAPLLLSYIIIYDIISLLIMKN